MTTLRALVGACFLLAVMGIVVAVPLGWALVLVAAAEKADLLTTNTATVEYLKGRPSQRKAELVQNKILSRAANEGITYKRVAKEK